MEYIVFTCCRHCLPLQRQSFIAVDLTSAHAWYTVPFFYLSTGFRFRCNVWTLPLQRGSCILLYYYYYYYYSGAASINKNRKMIMVMVLMNGGDDDSYSHVMGEWVCVCVCVCQCWHNLIACSLTLSAKCTPWFDFSPMWIVSSTNCNWVFVSLCCCANAKCQMGEKDRTNDMHLDSCADLLVLSRWVLWVCEKSKINKVTWTLDVYHTHKHECIRHRAIDMFGSFATRTRRVYNIYIWYFQLL